MRNSLSALTAVLALAAQPTMAKVCSGQASVEAKPTSDGSYIFSGEIRSTDCVSGDCAGTTMIGIDKHWADGSASHEGVAVPYRIKSGQGVTRYSVSQTLYIDEGRSASDLKGVTAHAFLFTCFTPVVDAPPD